MGDLLKLDLYDLLGVSWEGSEKEIRTAYRKKALSCHPDKNPDNPKAAELFQQLSRALEILTDTAARAAYDKVLRAKKAAQKRNQELDSKRKKFKEDLELRERAGQEEKQSDVDASERLRVEIERLRKEGSKQLEEEQERMRRKIQEELNLIYGKGEEKGPAHRLKVSWKAKKHDPDNGGYNHDLLNTIFSKYGEVTCLVVSSKKRGSALVEFSSAEPAETAYRNEVGSLNNPLTLSWLSGAPTETSSKTQDDTTTDSAHSDDTKLGPTTASAESSNQPLNSSSVQGNLNYSTSLHSTVTESDYENLVLMRMRQAAERQRLVEQMTKEDGEG